MNEFKASPYTYKFKGDVGYGLSMYHIFEGEAFFSSMSATPKTIQAFTDQLNIAFNRGARLAMDETIKQFKVQLGGR